MISAWQQLGMDSNKKAQSFWFVVDRHLLGVLINFDCFLNSLLIICKVRHIGDLQPEAVLWSMYDREPGKDKPHHTSA